MDFQEELSDMLLLKMLQAATRAAADKDRVRAAKLSHSHKHAGYFKTPPNSSVRSCRVYLRPPSIPTR